MTGLIETTNLPGHFPNVDKTKYARQGGIFLSVKLFMLEMAVETILCSKIDLITIILK
jgi:hypothetical protein